MARKVVRVAIVTDGGDESRLSKRVRQSRQRKREARAVFLRETLLQAKVSRRRGTSPRPFATIMVMAPLIVGTAAEALDWIEGKHGVVIFLSPGMMNQAAELNSALLERIRVVTWFREKARGMVFLNEEWAGADVVANVALAG